MGTVSVKSASKMRESVVEKYLVQQVKKFGGEAEKFVSPGRRNVPDRLISWPGNIIHFVECKRPGKKLRPGQARDVKRRLARSNRVLVVDSKYAVDAYCMMVATELAGTLS